MSGKACATDNESQLELCTLALRLAQDVCRAIQEVRKEERVPPRAGTNQTDLSRWKIVTSLYTPEVSDDVGALRSDS